MPTECNAKRFEFEAVERRAVVAGFDGGDITSNAGALVLGQVDRGLCLMRRFGVLHRPARSALRRASGGDAGGAADLWPRAGLRGPCRSR